MQTGAWAAVCLLAFDVAANRLSPYPSDPRVTPKQMSLYLNYGRSIEGKLAQMVRPTDESSHPLVNVGWLDPTSWKQIQARPAKGENLLVVKQGKLEEVQPTVQSATQFRAALQNSQQWQQFTEQLQANDQYYNPFLFKHNFLDNSTIVRMVRRAYAQQHQKAMEQQAYQTGRGFNQSYEVPVLQAMVTEFAATAKQDGKLPIVLLINDRGYSDDLFKSLQPTLAGQSIPYVSTHEVASASDLSNFIADGHFTESANEKIAAAMLKLVNERATRLPEAKTP